MVGGLGRWVGGMAGRKDQSGATSPESLRWWWWCGKGGRVLYKTLPPTTNAASAKSLRSALELSPRCRVLALTPLRPVG